MGKLNRHHLLIPKEDIKEFPYQDLLTIDRLWVKYSDGRFGFTRISHKQ
ncbi:MAG: GUN4 domain-containing protein [Nostoc sp.]